MRAQNVKELGMVVKDRRAQLGLSQQQLADRAGVSRRWLVRVESGHPRAEAGALFHLLAALELLVVIEPLDRAIGQDEQSEVDLDAILGGLAPRRPTAAQ